MIKYSFILLGIYFVYYTGNFVYDLFIQKNKQVETDQIEEFSISDFANSEAKKPQNIGIDDVENLITPNSFVKDEISSATTQEEPDIDDLRKKFEAEQELDEFNSNIVQEPNDIQNIASEPIYKEIQEQKSSVNWNSLLALSETSVQLVKNIEGQKVYHSIL